MLGALMAVDSGTAAPSGIADPTAIVTAGNARFTMLTPRVLRIEYGTFMDLPSLTFINRKLPVPQYASHDDGKGLLTINTANNITLTYNYSSSTPPPDVCMNPMKGYDANGGSRLKKYPQGLDNQTEASCCQLCQNETGCAHWIFADSDFPKADPHRNCWLMSEIRGKVTAAGRVLGQKPSSPHGNPFFSRSLRVNFQGEQSWEAGQIAKGNLGGTISSWNEVQPSQIINSKTGQQEQWQAQYPGLLSTEGWSLVDDSNTPLYDSEYAVTTASRPWIKRRGTNSKSSMNSVDWYLFLCGHEYATCLHDYSLLAGKMTLPPPSALGVWYSHYEKITQADYVNDILGSYAKFELPLNMAVSDMDWHIEPSRKIDPDCQSWGGFTWNETLWPNHTRFLHDLHHPSPSTAAMTSPGGSSRNNNNTGDDNNNNNPTGRPLKFLLNTHSFLGVGPCQAMYRSFAAALGCDAETAHNATMPLVVTNETNANAFFDKVLGYEDLTQVDYWWTDGALSKWDKSTGWAGNARNLLWFAYLHDSALRMVGRRPLVLPRFGGLGQHRYPIGFSGDAVSAWPTLQAEVAMTPVAANVLFGYWSHDIGGFSGEDPSDELMLRWVQFGAVAPILRTHGKHGTNRRLWTYPSFPRMKQALQLRARLAPFLYAAARAAYDTGVAGVHPMYIDYPHAEGAVADNTTLAQYMLGPVGRGLLAAPVTVPAATADTSDGDAAGPTEPVALKRVWLPQGEWVEWSDPKGDVISVKGGSGSDGGRTVSRRVGLGELPLYVPAGMIMALSPLSSLDATDFTSVVWTIFPAAATGSGSGSYTMYEDDAERNDYETDGGAFATTGANYTWEDADVLHVNVGATASVGGFADAPATRKLSLELRGREGQKLPTSVTVNGRVLPAAAARVSTNGTLALPTGALLVDLGEWPTTKDVSVEVEW